MIQKAADEPSETKPATVTVRARVRLAEAGTMYAPGDEFETTNDRAGALGDLVEVRTI